METKIFTTDEIAMAATAINAGQLVAFPTETVYGLGADATNEEAVKQVYLAKGRPSDNPLIVHVADEATVEKYAEPLSDKAKQLIQIFWPGPLTLIFKLQPNALSKSVTGGLDTAAFRNPKNEATLELIRQAGVPLVGPSANTSGKPSPTLAKHVYHDLQGKIAGILDDGPTQYGVESTVLDMSTDTPTILRPGAVTEEQLTAVIGPVISSHHHVGKNEVPKAPGMKYKHYAPSAQVYIVDSPTDWPVIQETLRQNQVHAGILATNDVLTMNDFPENVEPFSLGEGINGASHALFAGLRHFDLESDVKVILAQAFPDDHLGAAYMNRLDKSAGGVHFNAQHPETLSEER
ncbi:L-threonylcarbamoyladenylate synthase [Levilactobacillus bambusae]|uniref:Threonylcarbamoyl-AMP synthase n=1 Tax=Levilactobacillus bambusae TaxID=2024736 RepID=A0A2V1MWR3_9LACO|nr:L-threonylcarbamoyladenylate synthase [Levilactobacillus bambusae]PWF99520.1 threonylcarbamoyl-AMP synthase [Levilactobacillus bambusae]